MYGRWVPGMSEGLHCSQPALDRELLPWLVIPATQPLVPTPNQPRQPSHCVKDGCLGCLGASIVASWHLDGEPLPWLAIPATKQWAPIPVPSCPGPVRMPGMSGSRFCDQPAPGKRTAPMAGNPRRQPSHRPHPAPGCGAPVTLCLQWKLREWGRRGKKK